MKIKKLGKKDKKGQNRTLGHQTPTFEKIKL